MCVYIYEYIYVQYTGIHAKPIKRLTRLINVFFRTKVPWG